MNLVKGLQVAGLARYLITVRQTSRVSIERETQESALVAFWHDAIPSLLAAARGRQDVAIYIRAQPFIEDVLDLLADMGIPTFVSDHQGTAGLKAARRWLSTPGRLLGITADVGAPRTALPGVGRLARMLGVPLCPLTVTASHGYRMSDQYHKVVPHLGGEVTVRVLPRVSEPSFDATAAALERALAKSTLSEPAPSPLVPWRRGFELWPRLCLAPRTRGKLKVWPATEATELIF